MADGTVDIEIDLDDSEVKPAIRRLKSGLKSLEGSWRNMGRVGTNAIRDLTRGLKEARGHVRQLGDAGKDAMDDMGDGLKGVAALAAGAAGAKILGLAMGVAAGFSAAAAGIVGFGAVAAGVLGKSFEASEELSKIQEDIQMARALGDMEKVNDLMRERAAILETLTAEQRRAAVALQDFRAFWHSFTADFQKPVVDIFTQSLQVLRSLLINLKPAIMGATEAIGNLLTQFGRYTETKEFQDFMNWLGTHAGPQIEKFGTIAGNIMRGIMNLFMYFTPQMNSATDGLVRQTGAFADWTAQLREGNTALQQFWTKIKNQVGPALKNLSEGIKQADPQQITTALIVLINKATTALLERIKEINWQQVALAIGQGLSMLSQYIGVIMPHLINAFKVVFNAIPWDVVFQPIKEKAPEIARNIIDVLKSALQAAIPMVGELVPLLMQLGITMALTAATTLIDPVFWAKILWENLWTVLTLIFMPAKWAGVIGKLLGKIPLMGKVMKWIVEGLNKIGGPLRKRFGKKFREWIEEGKKKMKNFWDNKLKPMLKEKADGLVETLKNKADDWIEIGKDWLGGVLEGLGKKARTLYRRVESIARKAVRKFKAIFKIKSPSRVMRDIGIDINRGLIKGLDRTMPKVERSFERGARRVLSVADTKNNPGGSVQHFTAQFMGGAREFDERDMMRAFREMQWVYGG